MNANIFSSTPIWTAFITHYISSPTWFRRTKNSSTVYLADLQRHVFSSQYSAHIAANGEHFLDFELVQGRIGRVDEDFEAGLIASRCRRLCSYSRGLWRRLSPYQSGALTERMTAFYDLMTLRLTTVMVTVTTNDTNSTNDNDCKSCIVSITQRGESRWLNTLDVSFLTCFLNSVDCWSFNAIRDLCIS